MAIKRYTHAPALIQCPYHRVELYTRQGLRLARLYGEDRRALEERATRWQKHISKNLDVRCPDD